MKTLVITLTFLLGLSSIKVAQADDQHHNLQPHHNHSHHKNPSHHSATHHHQQNQHQAHSHNTHSYGSFWWWAKQPKCHTHNEKNAFLHQSRRDISWRQLARWWRHFKRHWLGGHYHCEPSGNQAPSVNINAPDTALALQNISLDGSASSDPDGNIASYAWVQTAGSAVNLSGSDQAVASFTAPVVSTDEILRFELTLTDDQGETATREVSINLSAAQSPEVSASGPGTVLIDDDPSTPDTLITLTSQVNDADSSTFTYSWQQISGSPEAIINNPSAQSTEVALPEVLTPTQFTFAVTVTDETALSASDEVIVIVEPEQASSTLSGRVTDINGQVITGAEIIIVGGNTGPLLTNNEGVFSVELTAATNYVLQFNATSYAPQVLVITSPPSEGTTNVDIVMAEISASYIIGENDTGDITREAADGAAVSFNRADFVDASGQLVTGEFGLDITPVDISQQSTSRAFPGLFAGVAESSSEPVPIASLGTVNFSFSQNNEPVNLAPGASATITLPLYTATHPATGETLVLGQIIELWSLDEETGIWLQEGTGEVVFSADSPTELALRAEVSHFSWWNCDVAVQTAQVEVTVEGSDTGTALITGTADLGGSNWRGDTVNTTIAIGDTTRPLFIPANREVCFSASLDYNDDTSAQTEEVCIQAAPGELIAITLSATEPGPLDLRVNPESEEDETNIRVVLGFSQAISIFPVTTEASVTYSVLSGNLPAGLSLNTFNNRASIAGVAEAIGEYTFEIEGTDEDGETDTIVVNYSVVDEPLDVTVNFAENFDGIFTTGKAADTDFVNVSLYIDNQGTYYEGFYTALGAGSILAITPVSQEQSVSFELVGDLPPGLLASEESFRSRPLFVIGNNEIDFIDVNAPEQVGEAGNYTTQVIATDGEGGQDIVIFNFTVLEAVPPPLLNNRRLFLSTEQQQVNLNQVMLGGSEFIGEFDGIRQNNFINPFALFGGPVTNWEILEPGNAEAESCEQALALEPRFDFEDDNSDIPSFLPLPLPSSFNLNAGSGVLTFPEGSSWQGCVKGSNESGSDIKYLILEQDRFFPES